jgi:hypothetical protein
MLATYLPAFKDVLRHGDNPGYSSRVFELETDLRNAKQGEREARDNLTLVGRHESATITSPGVFSFGLVSLTERGDGVDVVGVRTPFVDPFAGQCLPGVDTIAFSGSSWIASPGRLDYHFGGNHPH